MSDFKVLQQHLGQFQLGGRVATPAMVLTKSAREDASHNAPHSPFQKTSDNGKALNSYNRVQKDGIRNRESTES